MLLIFVFKDFIFKHVIHVRGRGIPTHTRVQVLKKATKGYRVPGGWSYRYSVMAVCTLDR